ncbi:MAG: DUF86 domain-containing protein [Armatimonadetes bacterium]|nr:DUF86 domain-containing protein [Armatimonadota bacterium]
MPRESRKLLLDVRQALGHMRSFVDGKTYEDYRSSALLRAGVERQFEIIGEALNRLRKANPAMAEQIVYIDRIIAFRHMLIHGYDGVDDAVVWGVVVAHAPALREQVQALIDADTLPA